MQKDQQPLQQQKEILALMKQSRLYWQVRKQVLGQLKKTSKVPSTEQMLKMLGANEEKLTGLINNCLQKSTKRTPIQQDPNPQIGVFRRKWSEMIIKQFNNISVKILREEEYDQEDQSVSYIYDPMSLLEFLSSIKTRSAITVRDSPALIFKEDTLRVPRYQQLRSKYSFLLFQDNLLGGDLDLDTRQRQKKARKISDGQCISSQVESFLTFGCLNGQRNSVYKRYFECFYEYSGKRIEFSLLQKVWKPLIRTDIKEITQDQTYFVFKEEIIKTYRIFVCDRQLGHMVKIRQLNAQQAKLDKYAPVHHIIPSKSFAKYIAPFCYMATNPEDVYEVFRQVYSNYLILLNTVSSLPDSILSLCLLFQQLMWTTQPKIVQKMESLCIQPLKIVFPWMFYCFIGYMSIQQFFLLLDRIMGTKSLQILPLYCVSIFFKEKAAIMEAKTQNEVIQILQDSLREDVFVQTIREYFKYHL